MSYRIKIIITIVTMLTASVTSLIKKPSYSGYRWLSAYITSSALTELLAIIAALLYGNNHSIYLLFGPVRLFSGIVFFLKANYAVKILPATTLLSIGGIAFSLADTRMAGIRFNGFFTLYEGLLFILLSLLTFQRQLYHLHRCGMYNLYTAALFLIFYGGSCLIRFAVFFYSDNPDDIIQLHILYQFLYWLGILFYIGLTLPFLHYQRTQKYVS